MKCQHILVKFEVVFEPALEEFVEERSKKFTTVFSGPNNGGKSLVLKRIYLELGENAYLVGCNRMDHVDRLNTRERQQFAFHSNFYRQFYTARQNLEQNPFNLQSILVSMNNKQRGQLFMLCEEMLGNKFEIRPIQADNDFSPKYIDMDGQNLVYGSTGTRLLMTILGICLNNEFDTLLIDEPELGLSPKIQSILADYLYDLEMRRAKFPHLKHLYVATHSHLFLDKSDISNNFVVSKAGLEVSITWVTSINDFHHLQFNLLGNELEAIFLPSAIVFVEGETDHKYLSRLIQLSIPNKRITVVRPGRARGDGAIPEKLHTLKEAFGDLQKSPYKRRIFVVLDSQHSVKLGKITRQGVDEENIIRWSKNGIEYYYPREILAKVFSCGPDYDFENMEIEGEAITVNDIRKGKAELANEVDRELASHDSTTQLMIGTP